MVFFLSFLGSSIDGMVLNSSFRLVMVPTCQQASLSICSGTKGMSLVSQVRLGQVRTGLKRPLYVGVWRCRSDA